MKKTVTRWLLILGIGLGFALGNTPTFFAVDALSTQTIDTTLDCDAQINAYYSGVEGSTGTTLQDGLYDIIKSSTSMAYEETPYAMKITDRNWDLSPLSVGSHVLYDLTSSGSDDPYMNLLYATYNSSTSTAYRWSADHATIWNKEHTWAKSHGNFLEEAPAGTDLHHLRASDQANNNGHSNFDFGNVANVTSTFNDERGNPSGLLGTSASFSGDSIYEPRDADKGDVARMIFYMATRYNEYLSQGSPKLEIINGLSGSSAVTASATVTGKMGILSDLLQWNDEDPVSLFEIRRNNLIDHNFQGNRNPYIDHPEWADLVYDASYSGPGASLASGSSTSGAFADKTLTSITLDTRYVTNAYVLGETFSNNGLIVMATFSDGSSNSVDTWTTDYLNGTTLSTTGTFSVEVSLTLGGLTQTASYAIGVYDEIPVLQAISLNTESVTSTFALGSSFSHSGLLVTGVYNIGNKLLNSEDFTVASPVMTTLGEQSVQVSYGGKTASYPIFLTNSGASVGVGSPSSSASYAITTTDRSTFASGQTTGLTTNTLANVAWNYSYVWKTGVAYFVSSASRGTQIGSSSNALTSFTMESKTDFEANHLSEITRISFEGSGAVDASITLKAFVGETQVGSTATLTSNTSAFNTYDFTTSQPLSGKLRLVFTQASTSKALYFHGLSVYTLKNETGVTPKQQALALAAYVLSLPTCTLSDDDVSVMIHEYDAMTVDAKTHFDSLSDGSTQAKDRYDYIVSLHPNAQSTEEGEWIQLPLSNVSNGSFWFIFIALPFVMIGVGSLVWIFFRKKENKGKIIKAS